MSHVSPRIPVLPKIKIQAALFKTDLSPSLILEYKILFMEIENNIWQKKMV